MPSSSLSPEQVREWQLNSVTQALYQDLKAEVAGLKEMRPFTEGDPNQTYSDIVKTQTRQDTLDNLLPLFTEDPQQVAEILNEREQERNLPD